MSDFCERPKSSLPADNGGEDTDARVPSSGTVLHWYDFLCPFCYIAQSRNALLRASGFSVEELAFQAHPEIPREGVAVGPRVGPMYTHLEGEARAAGLPLQWPARLPDTRRALAAAEWTRRTAAAQFLAFQAGLFAAHFALGQDLGDPAVIDEHALAADLDLSQLHRALDDGTALAYVDQTESLGRSYGVRGTPAWLVRGEVISGLLPVEEFKRFLA